MLVVPQAVVRNYGNVVEGFGVIFRVGDIYEDTFLVSNLLPDSVVTVSFDTWVAVRGSYVVSCSTLLAGDLYLENNKRDSSLFVVYHDVGVEYIIQPVDTVLENEVVIPRARVFNIGNVVESFPVIFRVDSVGGGNVFLVIDTISLGVGETVDYSFSVGWSALRGNYIVSCSTMLLTDMNNLNNYRDSSLVVIAHDVGVEYIIQPVDTVLDLSLIHI